MQRGSNGIDFGEHQGVLGQVATGLVITHKWAQTNMDKEAAVTLSVVNETQSPSYDDMFHCTHFTEKYSELRCHIHNRNIHLYILF